jgi:ribosomal protein S18 acetylase RimI-like enzyme
MVISVDITAYSPDDRAAVTGLAPRLRSGVASWRPRDGVLLAVHQWVEESLDAAGDDHGVFVARVDGEVVGLVAVSEQRHWSGQRDAYIGELVTGQRVEGRGVGRALLARAEQWARDRGLDRITLETGAANSRARDFYERQGYQDEEVRLTRILSAQPATRVTG